MISLEENLMPFLVIEDGVEGATTAKHKVEFSFYNLNAEGVSTKEPSDLFGLIECKKVGVEVRELATNNLPNLLVLFHSLCVAKMVIYPDKLTFLRLD